MRHLMPSKPHRQTRAPASKNPRKTRVSGALALRNDGLRALLRGGWISLPDIMDRMGFSRATAFRQLALLGETDPVEKEEVEGRTMWRISPGSRVEPLRISTSEMVAIAFVRDALRFLAGTGIKEDLDAVFDRVMHALKKSDFALSRNLDKKLHDVNEYAFDYSDRIDVVNDILTALLREERLRVELGDGTKDDVEPYTLLLFKKGLYLVGRSDAQGVFRIPLDKIDRAEWRKGEKFDYPADYRPEEVRGDSFGIMRGPRTRIGIWFSQKVVYYIERRPWHHTQKLRYLETGGVELTMECEGTTELVSWVLGFGMQARVLEPKELRDQVRNELQVALARYTEDDPAVTSAEPGEGP
jgi:proteasome accessory factor B